MIIKVLYVALFLFAEPSADASIKPEMQSEPGDSIHTEMIVRSEDLFWQTGWTLFSLDRMSFRVNTGEYGYYGPQPKYLLDGIPVDPVFFGMNLPQLIPVPLNQVAELNTLNGMGVSDGVPYYSGMLNLKTNPVQDGFSVFTSTQLGHNSNEPGPWAYDRQTVTPNIDRFGNWTDLGFSLKIGPWYSKGHVQRLSFLNANPFVQTRIRNLIGLPEQGEYPDGRSTTELGLLETGIISDRLNFRLQGIRAKGEEFLFFQPLGREIPTDLDMDQLTASADLSFSRNVGFQAMAQYRSKGTGYQRNRFGERFDWQQVQQIGRGSFYIRSDKFELDFGSEYKTVEFEVSGMDEESEDFIELFVNQKTAVTPWLSFGSYSALTIHDEKMPVQLKGLLDVKITDGWSTGFETSYSELLPEISNPVDERISKGYDILGRLDIFSLVPHEIPNTKLMTLSSWQEFRFSNQIKTTLRADYFDHQQFNIPFQDAYYYLNLSTLPGTYILFSDSKGQRLKLSLNTEVEWSEQFHQTFGFYKTDTLEGDTSYKSYWKTIPEYIIRHTSIFNPFPDLEIRLDFEYQTETVWDEFRRLDGELNRTFNVQFPFQFFRFDNDIAPGLNMDLIFAKWFWEQRMRVVFMMNNLFNQDYQRHPLGSIDGFGYMVRFELRL